MKINKKEYDSYTIHHYKSNKYKTIYIKVIFRKPIKKEEITKTNLLFAVLGSGTNKYENEKLINIQMEELYGITTSASTRRVGTNLQQYITLEVLDDKYTEPGNLDKSIELFSELLLDPLVKDNAFDKDIVEREKGIFESYYKRIKENPSYYAYVRANEEYNDKSIISYRQNGYMEDLKDINEHNLYEYYKEFLKSNVIDIVVVGNIEFTKIDKLINKHFSNLKSISNKENKYLLNEKLLNKQIIKREKINNKQSNLVMLFRGDNLTEFERSFVLKLYSSILGESTNSKLFNTVREEKSLCYYINSVYNNYDNTLYIMSGIDRNNYDITLKEINKVIEESKKDLITEKDIETEKKSIEINLNNMLENNYKISNYIEQINIYNRRTIKERIENYKKITKKDIVNVVDKLKLESIFLLEGEYNERN